MRIFSLIRAIQNSALKWLCGLIVLLVAQTAFADSKPDFAQQITSEQTMAVIAKENKRCIRCHQKKRLIKNIDAITSVGQHASRLYYDNCTACHGNKGEHSKDDHAIIGFNHTNRSTIFEQNQQCITCHQPQALRAAEWTHDLHVKEMFCSTCHSLHQPRDPIIGITKKFRIGLCAFCHDKRSEETSSHEETPR